MEISNGGGSLYGRFWIKEGIKIETKFREEGCEKKSRSYVSYEVLITFLREKKLKEISDGLMETSLRG